mmetsp:Transcript_47315/g.145970  ORF Transcript_47315/g.145970 Transcript_47315/m.145970 type:complete len:201 (-) Transcript_47315:1023-1625(-)
MSIKALRCASRRSVTAGTRSCSATPAEPHCASAVPGTPALAACSESSFTCDEPGAPETLAVRLSATTSRNRVRSCGWRRTKRRTSKEPTASPRCAMFAPSQRVWSSRSTPTILTRYSSIATSPRSAACSATVSPFSRRRRMNSGPRPGCFAMKSNTSMLPTTDAMCAMLVPSGSTFRSSSTPATFSRNSSIATLPRRAAK